MTRIVITGACGKMGRVINDIVNTRDDCEITAGIDITGEQYADFPVYKKLFDLPEKPDVIIDFSHPSLLDELLDYCKINNVPVVIATTGYTDEQIKQIKTAAGQIPVFFTFNMSLGINLLVDLAKRAKAQNLDAIHDTVHEMAKDEARHGAGFRGLLNRYFK